MDETLCWRVEQTCFNAWPALRQVLFGGWAARISGGASRRINSVNPLWADDADIERRIGACEALYRRQSAPTLFRRPSFLTGELDAALDRRGYGLEGETLTLFAPAPPPAVETAGVSLLTRADADWLAATGRLQGHTPEQARVFARVVDMLAAPTRFAAARNADGEIVAIGYAALHDRIWCLESVVAAPAHRGQGHGRRLVDALGGWAAMNGAEAGCLQMVAGNAPAERLYRRSGFTRELYRYHYRRAP